MTESRVAFYKYMPTCNIPHRKGPLQVIRSCQSCIRDTRVPLGDGLDDVLPFMCYDDLVMRNSIWFSSYQSIQYHTGQFEVLRASLLSVQMNTLFVVAQTNLTDIKFLESALKHSISSNIQLHTIVSEAKFDTSNLDHDHYQAFPLLYQSCPSEISTKNASFGPSKLDRFLDQMFEKVTDVEGRNFRIVVVVITKEHDKRMLPGLGSVCIQMLEPFSLQDYARNTNTAYLSKHLVKHIYFNVAQSAAILPSQIISFLLLFLEREEGVSLDDLIKYTDWFRKLSLDIDMHLGFTGHTTDIVKFGLFMLKSLIYKSGNYYNPKDFKRLATFANPVTALIAYQGIIARAILVEHNKIDLTCSETVFRPDISVRVVRDDVISTGKLLAENLELILPCRKPCVDDETMLNQELSKMQLSGRYLLIQEPKINVKASRTFWAGEEDSDEEYFEMNKDKDAFKTWIQLTTDPQKLDRLNLFINAIGYSMSAVICE